jgi:hypothetical protein
MGNGNELLHRAATATKDAEAVRTKELEVLSESLRERTAVLLKEHKTDLKEKRHVAGDTIATSFSNFVKVPLNGEGIKVRFTLGADDVDIDQAEEISIGIPVLNETLILEKRTAGRAIGKEVSQDEPTVAHIVKSGVKITDYAKTNASYSQLDQYVGLMNLIEEKYAIPPAEAVVPIDNSSEGNTT